MNTYDPTETRLQLFRNGYFPTPNINKQCWFPGWNTRAHAEGLSEEVIRSWRKGKPRQYEATGLQARNGLMPIDFDITDEDIINEVLDEFARIVGEAAFAKMPWRTGKYPKLMAFARWEGVKTWNDAHQSAEHISGIEHTNKYIDGAGNSHMIEVFGGAVHTDGRVKKQVGVYGPHDHYRINDEKKGPIDWSRGVLDYYTWDADRPTLLDIRLEDLPPVTPRQINDVMAAFTGIALARGFTVDKDTAAAGAPGEPLYDITPETLFTVKGNPEKMSYYDLDEGMQCSASFIDDREHTSPDRCHVYLYRPLGILGVLDFHNETWHLPKSAEPPDAETKAAELAELLKNIPDVREPTTPPRPAINDSFTLQIEWLVKTHGFWRYPDKVVELYTPSNGCLVSPGAFAREFASWRLQVLGPKKGKKYTRAVDVWSVTPKRVSVSDVLMRPDKPFPTYQENGLTYKNTYLRPVHTGAGDIEPWLAFMRHLLPVENEREWFCNWVAHKHLNPAVPGVAALMVAFKNGKGVYGTGRGMLADILARLMGRSYVKPVDFDILSGVSAQSIYTDWAAYATLVFVSESKDTAESNKWSVQTAGYERLKQVIEPRATMKPFERKGLPRFEALCFASYLIASNNPNPVRLDPDDRRFTCLENGDQLPSEKAAALEKWMDNPGNIAELARWLEARDLSVFDVYTIMDTPTRRRMVTLSRTAMDDALVTVQELTGPHAMFMREWIELAVQKRTDGVGEAYKHAVRNLVRKAVQEVPSEIPLRSPREYGDRQRVYCWVHYSGKPARNSAAVHDLMKVTKTALDKDESASEALIMTLLRRVEIGSV